MAFSVALVGIEGFGRSHVRVIEKLASSGEIRCVAFADPNADPNGESYQTLTKLGAVPYADDTAMLAERPDIELVIIATPLSLHKPMAIRAMRAGRHVLVEKPPAVTVQDVDEMIRAQSETGKLCAVDFQSVTGSAFQRALKAVSSGEIGAVRRIVGVGLWKRVERYYKRTPWAGKLSLGGRLVLDGALMNPFAHLLQNCLLLADEAGANGSGTDAATLLESIQAEMYHANPIEGDDTSCVRIAVRGGVDVGVYVTLCNEESVPYQIEVFGDQGSLRWHSTNRLEISGRDGTGQTIEFPEEEMMAKVYRNVIARIEGRNEPVCTIDRCRAFIAAVNGALSSSGGVRPIPGEATTLVGEGDLSATVVPGLPGLFREAAARGALLSELGVPWAVPGRHLPLANFREFQLPS